MVPLVYCTLCIALLIGSFFFTPRDESRDVVQQFSFNSSLVGILIYHNNLKMLSAFYCYPQKTEGCMFLLRFPNDVMY